MTEATVNAHQSHTKQSLRSASYGARLPAEVRVFSEMAREFADAPYIRRRRRDVVALRVQTSSEVSSRLAKRGSLLGRGSQVLPMRSRANLAGATSRVPLDIRNAVGARGPSENQAGSAWLDLLGPFYSAESVRELLGRDGAQLSADALRRRRGLLALRAGSGQVVYPAFQFRRRASAPFLEKVLDALPESLVSRWSVASWLVTPETELDGERPIDLLHDGGPEASIAVIRSATRWAGQLGATD